MKQTLIFAHRGSAGTQPENTMASFEEAISVGADGIELDVQLTRDGQLAVIHDEKVDRTTDGTGYVKDLTLEEILTLNASYTYKKDVGHKIPTLEHVMGLLKPTGLLLNIELKNGVFLYPGMEERVISLIREYGMQDRVILSSFNHYSLVYCYRLAPEIETAPLYRDGLYMPWVYGKAIGAKGLHPSIKAAPDPIIIESMKEGMAVRPYTINDPQKMESLFAIGCTAFITDYPKKAVELRNKK
ncbi:glycerophosphodiester phosphodiesterase [Bacillus sp. 1P06AnD]|uniref:glycerophosphodiester phosphodiesterase n=1 Tax=Bacillus sp. 1P06AnD TaxID=3132208 RepID=UPI0039A12F59